jgi:hypothetical protein
MADPTAKELGQWILDNEDKAGTPEFEAVARAYDLATLGTVVERPTKSPEYKAGAEFVRSSPWGAPAAGINTAIQGATFGFGDELAGGLNVLANPLQPGQQYRAGRDQFRGMQDQFGKDYPVSNLLGGLGGGTLWGGPLAAISKAASPASQLSRMGRLANATTIGGVAGGISGAGGAENISDIPFEVMKHGAFGAAASPVLQGIGAGVGAAKNAATSLFDIGTGARVAAQRRVGEAISRADMTAPQAAARMGRQGFGGEARILDTSQATRDLADVVATLPGATRDKVVDFQRLRKIGQPERMDVLPELLNQGNRAAPTLELLNQVQAQTAKPLYAAVDNVVVPVTRKLESLFERPAFREAYNQARTNAANQSPPVTLPSVEELLQTGPAAGLPVKVWDQVKKGFDDVIAAKKRGLATPSGTNQAQSTLKDTRDMKNEMLDEIDRLTGGAYKAARDAHAGPAALKTAMEDGMSVWQMNATEINQALAQMSRSEQAAFRIGAGEALRAKVGSPKGQAELLNAWKDRNLREKLQVIYGDAKNYRTALSKILGEEQLGKAYGIGTGSQTARRMAGQEDLASGIAEDVAAAGAAVKTGSIPGVLAAVKRFGSRASMPEPVRNEIGRILLKGGAAGKDELAQIEAIIRMYNEQQAGRAAFTGVMAPQLFR